jgi:hypothetical protein
VPQYFLPARERDERAALVYTPMLLGAGTVRFVDAKAGVDTTEEGVWLTPIGGDPVPVRWDRATEADVAVESLARAPDEPAEYAPLPPEAAKARSYEGWRRDLATWLAGERRLTLYRDARSRQLSRPEESERDFRVRLQEAARETRDAVKDRLRQKYAPRQAALEERLRRAQHAVAREEEQVTHQGIQTAISVGATILGAFLGRKATSVSGVGRATTAARGAGRVLKERQDVGRARDTVQAVERQLADLEAEFTAEMARLETTVDPLGDRLDTVDLRPKKTHVTVTLCALVWAPHRRDAGGGLVPAWR